MTERRSLVEGTKTPPPIAPSNVAKERAFVHGTATITKSDARIERLPLNTRIRSDYAKTLKRVSLERQLAGQEPHTLQEVLEEALESWMQSQGLPR